MHVIVWQWAVDDHLHIGAMAVRVIAPILSVVCLKKMSQCHSVVVVVVVVVVVGLIVGLVSAACVLVITAVLIVIICRRRWVKLSI